MSKRIRWSVVIPVAIILVVASSSVIAAATPFAYSVYCDPYGDLPFVAQEATDVANILYPTYIAAICCNFPKSAIIYGLNVVDLFHFAGYGGRNWYGQNWLVTGDDQKLYGKDIPDLTVQWTFDCMRFAFANACHSGIDSFWPWVKTLPDGFIGNGAEAYLGWDDTVFDWDAYVYAITFYDLAITNGWSVAQTRSVTEDLIGTPGANSVLYGDGSVTLIP